MTATVFIDGEAGTTGLQILARLAGRRDIRLLSLAPDQRKDPEQRRRALNQADVSILCLPDDAAREAVAMLDNPSARVIDASTAHRVAPGWTYGFPEMARGQADAIAKARFVANPGCYPTGVIAMVRPLVEAGLLPADFPVTVNAVSGYSGGGKALIAAFEDPKAANRIEAAWHAYGLSLAHKHVPEMQAYSRLAHPPLFAPSVGRYHAGMVVEVPLQLWALPGTVTGAHIHACLADHFAGSTFARVVPIEESARLPRIEPDGLNDSNFMQMHVFSNEKTRQCRLVAVYDNLGKGASGAAVQSMNLMLGLAETAGLVDKLAA